MLLARYPCASIPVHAIVCMSLEAVEFPTTVSFFCIFPPSRHLPSHLLLCSQPLLFSSPLFRRSASPAASNTRWAGRSPLICTAAHSCTTWRPTTSCSALWLVRVSKVWGLCALVNVASIVISDTLLGNTWRSSSMRIYAVCIIFTACLVTCILKSISILDPPTDY